MSVLTLSQTDGNLYTFALPEGADKKLERKGSYHLGELVNRFVAGGLGGLIATSWMAVRLLRAEPQPAPDDEPVTL